MSRRGKRSEVRSVSTQATECRPGRVLHEVTDSLEAQKLAIVTEVTIGDSQQVSTAAPFYVRARHASLDKKRRGLSRVLSVRTKAEKKQPGHTSRADFSVQYDFLALPGQVSPAYRKRSEDVSSTEKKPSAGPLRPQTAMPDALAARTLATTEEGGPEVMQETGQKHADRPKAPSTAARSRKDERLSYPDGEVLKQSKERRTKIRSSSLEVPRVTLKLRADGRAQQKASSATVRASIGDGKPSLEVSNSTGREKASQNSPGLEELLAETKIDERNTTLDATRAVATAVWESEEQSADENCNILKEGTVLEDLRNSEIYGACPDNDMAAIVTETMEETTSEPLVNRNSLLNEEINEIRQSFPLSVDDKDLTEAHQENQQTTERLGPSERKIDDDTGDSTLQHNCSGELQKSEVETQKQMNAEASIEMEDQAEVEEDEDIAEDTLDWNADDRTRSPSDSRPNSISSSYASDEDCTIDAIEATVNQRQTSMAALQDLASSTHSSSELLSSTTAHITSASGIGGVHHLTEREKHTFSAQDLLPAVNQLEETGSLSTTAENEFGKVPSAPLVMPEESDIYFPTYSVGHPTSLGCIQQQRDVCIQKSSHNHSDICMFAEFTALHDPLRSGLVSTADAAQQTILTQSQNIDTRSPVQETLNEMDGETDVSFLECKAEDTKNKMPKVDTNLISGVPPQKSLLAMQENQAMTLLILRGALPMETESEGAILGAGDAQNLDNSSGMEESCEVTEMEGIAVMLRTQSKSSCKLEQLQASDQYENLSRLTDSGLSYSVCEDVSDEEARQTIIATAAEELHCQNSFTEVSTTGAEDLNVNDRFGSSTPEETLFNNCAQQHEMPSVTAASLQEVEEPHSENGKLEQASDSTGEEDQEAGSLSFAQLSTVALDDLQPGSILSLSEYDPSSTELTAGSVADILEKSSSFPCLEPSLGVASSTSEEDWDVVPLRRVPAHTDLYSARASASLTPAFDEKEISSTDAEQTPECQNGMKDLKDGDLEVSPQSVQLEPHAVQPFNTYAEGDSIPKPLLANDSCAVQDSPVRLMETFPLLEEKINLMAEVPPLAPQEEGIGDLLPPKSTVTDPPVARMEDAAQNGNANNSQSQAMTSAGKKKKKKRGGKGKQK